MYYKVVMRTVRK